MTVANAESVLDTIAEKGIEKLCDISFDIPADKDGGNESANFLGYFRSEGTRAGETKAIEVIFVNKLTNNRETIPEIRATPSHEEHADPTKKSRPLLPAMSPSFLPSMW